MIEFVYLVLEDLRTSSKWRAASMDAVPLVQHPQISGKWRAASMDAVPLVEDDPLVQQLARERYDTQEDVVVAVTALFPRARIRVREAR